MYASPTVHQVKLLDQFDIYWDHSEHKQTERTAAHKRFATRLEKLPLPKQVEFLEVSVAVLRQYWRQSSYGGAKWAKIAQAVLSFLKGECDHTVFADHAFDLQHNSGTAFNKNAMLELDRDNLQSQLDVKQRITGASKLFSQLGRVSYSSRCHLSPDVEALYREGARLRLWDVTPEHSLGGDSHGESGWGGHGHSPYGSHDKYYSDYNHPGYVEYKDKGRSTTRERASVPSWRRLSRKRSLPQTR